MLLNLLEVDLRHLHWLEQMLLWFLPWIPIGVCWCLLSLVRDLFVTVWAWWQRRYHRPKTP